MMSQFKDVQKKMEQSKEELGKIVVEGSSGGDMVTAKMDGNLQLLSVSVDDVTLSDKEMMEQLIVGAVNNAMEKAKQKAEEEMKKNAGDMLGGIDLSKFKFPGM